MRHLDAYDLFIPTIELTDIRLVSKREAFPEQYPVDEARSSDTVRVFKENLEAMGMNARESGQSIIIKFARPSEYDDVAELRVFVDGEFAGVDMIDVIEPVRKQGVGTKIYQALLDAALATGLKGISSTAFDSVSGTGQQRSPGATTLLINLVNTNGGTITEVIPDEDDIQDLKTDRAPFYGPPYYDIRVDKSGKAKRKKA